MTMLTEEGTQNFAQLDRWRVRYHDAGSGYPVLLLHGSGPGATAWSNFGPNIEALAKKYRVIAPDFPGWGLSDAFDPETGKRFDVNAQVVISLMDHLKIEKAADGFATLVLAVAWWWFTYREVIGYGYLPASQAGYCLVGETDVCALARAICRGAHPLDIASYSSIGLWIGFLVLCVACGDVHAERAGRGRVAISVGRRDQ